MKPKKKKQYNSSRPQGNGRDRGSRGSPLEADQSFESLG
ncbi:hypothetical protein Gogos_016266 [Gossypium gossypioides]|uniref:Uncharacterized protein n=1 Tax=Gossypium gossypioides TaxID=34282 RepID=A0A7J9B7A3_GOSGO|nr:hypothetical protein [Gossypium gossypioides]